MEIPSWRRCNAGIEHRLIIWHVILGVNIEKFNLGLKTPT
jgi:hypothetical protein